MMCMTELHGGVCHRTSTPHKTENKMKEKKKAGLYRIWCGVHRLDDSGVQTLGDTSAFVNPAGQPIVNPAG